ncbi:MAG: 2-hydroxyacyl-CoA dehydratase family protein [Deltaproteobacteria bacterium]|nr:2-hydroxyacyl-CoA dehydratase family protein [Deltaproteobacteria bacterium]
MSLGKQVNYLVQGRLLGPAALALGRRQEVRAARARARRGPHGLVPPLQARYRMKELISRQYLAGNFVEGARKVAWVATGAPVEIVQALGFFIYYPDNHAALCGARRQAVELAETAEDAGYSRDICSYPRTEIGAFLAHKSPVGRVPKPDLIVCSNNICQTILSWYQVMAAYHGAEFCNLDTPFLEGEPQEHQLAYVRAQLEELISVAERISGRRLNYQKLQDFIRHGREASLLWLEILNRAKTRPAPLNAFDAFINMGPIVALRGYAATTAFYRDMLEEVDQRIARGVGAVAQERARVLWDNLPIWYRMRWLSELLGRAGVNVVLSNYTYGWGELAPCMDDLRPLESMAKVYLLPYLNRDLAYKMGLMQSMVRDFELDGVILHSDRSCKPYSIGQMDQRDVMMQEAGVPALLLEADHNDSRVFTEQQAQTRLEAFAEMLTG